MKRFTTLVTTVVLVGMGLGIFSTGSEAQESKGRPKKSDAPKKLNPAVDNEIDVQYGPEHVTTQDIGVTIKAIAGSVKEAYGTLQIPTNWPEQSVRVVKENITAGVRNSKDRETGLLKQFLFHIPFIEAGKEETALFSLEYIRKDILLPGDTSAFVIPKKVEKELKIYLGESPKLDPKSGKVTQTLKEIVGALPETATDWERIEAIFNWVKENVSRHMAAGATTADVLKSKKGNTEDIVATFVALCRAAKVPARMVWLTEGVSAEFYLQDDSGKGRWFPCSYGAVNEFGFSTETRPILLKGDSFRVPSDIFQDPDQQKGVQRQIVESLKCAAGAPGAGRPQVDFIRRVTSSPTSTENPANAPPGAAVPSLPTEKKPGEAFIPIPGAKPPQGGAPSVLSPPGAVVPRAPANGQAAPKDKVPK